MDAVCSAPYHYVCSLVKHKRDIMRIFFRYIEAYYSAPLLRFTGADDTDATDITKAGSYPFIQPCLMLFNITPADLHDVFRSSRQSNYACIVLQPCFEFLRRLFEYIM